MKTALQKIVGVHLDLKYHMPRKAYLLDWIARLPGYGINAVLIEYEDKFPFEKYPFLASPDAFTPEELRTFLAAARDAGLMTIPLIQTLSHCEFALAHEALAHLREAPDVPTQICPTHPEAIPFIKALMLEVMAYHESDPLFHCGGDETWFLGTCDRCREQKERLGKIGMWAAHEKPLLDVVIKAGKRPIVWDDILWSDFNAIETMGLPKETILHAWNYHVGKAPTATVNTEHGSADTRLKQIEIYNKAGYDSIAAPCYNYGQLFSRHAESVSNTAAWADKMHASNMMGMLNTSWAVFHVPLQVQNLYVALTGALCADAALDADIEWQTHWFEQEFGVVSAEGAPEAFQVLGELWEISTPGYDRPFSPLVYGYMSMVYWYEGGQDERKRRGAYPLDWNEVDFCELYRRGVEAVSKCDTFENVTTRLDRILDTFPDAISALERLSTTAIRHKDEAQIMVVLGEMKLLSARIFSHLLRSDGDTAALKHDMEAIKPMLQNLLAACYEEEGQERLLRAWWDPAYTALA